MKIGTKVRTQCGSRENPWYAYGTIAEVTTIDGETAYKVQWTDGGYDYCYDFELEAYEPKTYRVYFIDTNGYHNQKLLEAMCPEHIHDYMAEYGYKTLTVEEVV